MSCFQPRTIASILSDAADREKLLKSTSLTKLINYAVDTTVNTAQSATQSVSQTAAAVINSATGPLMLLS